MRPAPLLAALLPALVSATLVRPAAAEPQAPAVAIPAPPEVNDPLLAPVPPPRRVLRSWDEAVALLRSRSTDLRIAIDQLRQAESQTRKALAAYLPTVTGKLVYNRQVLTRPGSVAFDPSSNMLVTTTEVPIPNTLSGNIVLTQTLLDVSAFDQIGIAEVAEDVSAFAVEDRKRTLALALANQIVSVVTAERSAEINRVGLRVALEQLDIAKRKQTLGAATGLDVVRAEQNAANARATLITGDESLRESREALGLALGVPEETGVASEVNVDGLASSALATCRAVQSIDDRPDIAGARASLEVAKRNLRNVWFTFLPTIDVQSTVSQAFVPGPQSNYPNPTWSISGVLTVPIWDGGLRYAALRNNRAQEDIAGQNLEAARRQAIIQVQQAQRQLTVAETSDAVARQQRDLAAQNDQMTQTAYMAGQGTSLELVTASEAHRQAELNLALADFNVVKARLLAVLALATCPF